jgi:hypothetical protein
MQIEIDFDVYKKLTTMRRAEDHGYNDVLRELLGLPLSNPIIIEPQGASAGSPIAAGHAVAATAGLHSRGLFLPLGTRMRATYKGCRYDAIVGDGVIENTAGNTFTSPSAAATAITKTAVNGWRFWEAKRPNDLSWHRLDQMP